MINPAKKREDEIRKKILALKKEGRLKKETNNSEKLDESRIPTGDPDLDAIQKNREKMKKSAATTDYSDRVASKLGGKTKINAAAARMGRSIQGIDTSSITESVKSEPSSVDGKKLQLGRKDKVEDNVEYEPDQEEEELFDIVAKKLAEKQEKAAAEKLQQREEEEKKAQEEIQNSTGKEIDDGESKKTTSGVGGNWKKTEDQPEADYTPVRGSWGAFPRPKNISTAYGGGRQIGAGVEGDLTNKMKISEEDTKKRLQAYRERVGIDVKSEKDNAETIEEAMRIASLAMQRGIYTTAVSALEKVTQYCSTNSPVGGKVFLELAMAYEASGRTEEAITVYTTLTTSRMENIKFSAKRLLYGIEAMNFMRNDAKVDSFSRKAATTTFIDTTGLGRFAENFDDKYETAYVDLDKSGGFYKKLTENVVRSHREARQILLRARGSGEVDRLRVLQAIRTIARKFDDALSTELQTAAKEKEERERPIVVINGVPLQKKKEKKSDESMSQDMASLDKFQLGSPKQMMDNLNGEWKLQLMADKKGDSVKYFNTTLAWQNVDSSNMKFKSCCPAGFIKTSQEGTFSFNDEKRVINRDIVSTSGTAGFLSGAILGSGLSRTGAAAAALSPQQIISVDSSLCISRLYGVKVSYYDNVKDFYCVWRKVENGTYSEK